MRWSPPQPCGRPPGTTSTRGPRILRPACCICMSAPLGGGSPTDPACLCATSERLATAAANARNGRRPIAALLPEAKHQPRPSDPVLAHVRPEDREQAAPRIHIARGGRSIGATVTGCHAAPIQSRKHASAGPTREAWFATKGLASSAAGRAIPIATRRSRASWILGSGAHDRLPNRARRRGRVPACAFESFPSCVVGRVGRRETGSSSRWLVRRDARMSEVPTCRRCCTDREQKLMFRLTWWRLRGAIRPSNFRR